MPVEPLRARHFLLMAVVYLYAFPYFDQLRSANEMPRILMTQQIVDRHTFALDERLGDLGSHMDLSHAPNGHWYPNKAPGPSFLAVPAYVVCKWLGTTSLRACTWAFRVTAVTVPALFFLFFFYRMTVRFSPDEPSRRAALCAYALASPALPYAMLFFSHQLAAVFSGLAFIAAVAAVKKETRRPVLAAAATGFLAVTAVMMDYQSAIVVIVLGAYVLVRARDRRRTTALMIAGGLAPAAALLAYHAACFGSPLSTGYAYAIDPAPHAGFMGLVGPSVTTLWSTFLLPSNGILVLAPWVLLAAAGGIAIAKDPQARARVGAEAIVCATIFMAYLLFLTSLVPYMARGGWCVGPRYITVSLPFVAWLAVPGFALADRWRAARVIAQALVLAPAAIYVAASTTYPHWPDQLLNPLYELVFRLLYRGYAVHSLGTAIGLHGFLSLLPLYLFAFALAFWLLARGPGRSWRSTALACVLAAGIVAGHRAFPLSGAYSERAWSYITSTWEPK